MKKGIAALLICVVAISVGLWLPKKLWIRSMEQRYAYVLKLERECHDEACKETRDFELELFLHDIKNPPWYVVGAGQGKLD